MPNFITIDTITGVPPYHIYLCDTNFDNCVYIDTIDNSDIPYNFQVPPIFEDLQNYVIRFQGDGGCAINNYVNTLYKACRYSQWETLFWMTYQYNPSGGPFDPISNYMSSFIVNGIELLSGYYDFTVDSPVTPTLQNGVYNYSTIVDWFNNNVFPTLGLTGYTAQMSFVSYGVLGDDSLPYFYIIYPKDDTFSFIVNNWASAITYSDTGVSTSGGGYGSYVSNCDISTIINSPTGPQVLE
jgi:hypothetical protein